MNRRIYKLLFFCMVSMLSVFVHAGNVLQVTYQIGDGPEVTSSGNEGELSKLLGGEENAMKVTQLSVNGNLGVTDYLLLQKMAGKGGKGSLNSLNLSGATFLGVTNNLVPTQAFENCKNLQKVDLSTMTAIGIQAFANCTALTEISIPASVTKIYEGAFANNSALKKVIVNSGTQIDARYDNGVFSGMDPNNVQVEFVGEAEANYRVYRDDIVVDDKHYKNAFMYLLTKTLDENSTDYTVVAQRHADVRLKRTFKAEYARAAFWCSRYRK